MTDSIALAEIAQGTLLAHVGMPKTATTAIQESLAAARPELLKQGVFYPGTKHNQSAASFALARRVHGWRGELEDAQSTEKPWDDLVASIRATDTARVAVSHEYFAELPARRVHKFVADVERPVRVVFTLRNQASLLSSTWQQTLKGGQARDFDDWLKVSLHQDPAQRYGRLWLRLQLADLVAKWAKVVGEENVTAIVVDKADPSRVFTSFERLLGLPAGFLPAEGDGKTANRSMTASEAALIQQINADVLNADGRSWRVFQKTYRNGAINRLLASRVPAADEQKIVPPEWAVEQACELTEKHVARIKEMNVQVVGDLDSLASEVPALADGAASAPQSVEIDAASIVASGLLRQAFLAEESRLRAKKSALAKAAALRARQQSGAKSGRSPLRKFARRVRRKLRSLFGTRA